MTGQSRKLFREMQVARGFEVVWYLFEWACVFQICREWIFKKHISKKSVVSDKKVHYFYYCPGDQSNTQIKSFGLHGLYQVVK